MLEIIHWKVSNTRQVVRLAENAIVIDDFDTQHDQ